MRPSRRSVTLIGLAFLFLWAVLPIAWLVGTAFKRRLSITASPPEVIFRPTITNFRSNYNGVAIGDLLTNGAVIAVTSALIATAIGGLAGYALARVRSKLSTEAFWFILASRMTPVAVLSVPCFLLFSEIGLRGTHLAVIIVHTVANVSFPAWLLWRTFRRTPQALEFAAQIDGAGVLRAIIDTSVRAARAPIAISFFICFLFSWNEYALASILAPSSGRPIAAALPAFMAQGASQWGWFAAAATVATLPPLAIAFALAKHLSDGIEIRSGVRG